MTHSIQHHTDGYLSGQRALPLVAIISHTTDTSFSQTAYPSNRPVKTAKALKGNQGTDSDQWTTWLSMEGALIPLHQLLMLLPCHKQTTATSTHRLRFCWALCTFMYKLYLLTTYYVLRNEWHITWHTICSIKGRKIHVNAPIASFNGNKNQYVHHRQNAWKQAKHNTSSTLYRK